MDIIWLLSILMNTWTTRKPHTLGWLFITTQSVYELCLNYRNHFVHENIDLFKWMKNQTKLHNSCHVESSERTLLSCDAASYLTVYVYQKPMFDKDFNQDFCLYLLPRIAFCMFKITNTIFITIFTNETMTKTTQSSTILCIQNWTWNVSSSASLSMSVVESNCVKSWSNASIAIWANFNF